MKRKTSAFSEEARDEKRRKIDEDKGVAGSGVGPEGRCRLLELSDDVLMAIMAHLDSVSIFQLGETCLRLKRVSGDSSLWRDIDLTAVSLGVKEATKMLVRAGEKTKSIRLKGFFTSPVDLELRAPESIRNDPELLGVWRENFDIFDHHDLRGPEPAKDKETISPHLMKTISKKCPKLEGLHLICCNINADKTDLIESLPSTLTNLSIVHCNITNLNPKVSPLSQIDAKVPFLKRLDLSFNPTWLTNHSIQSACKLENLEEVSYRGCKRIGEGFAYTALATRFGFRKVKKIDLRDTSAGNAEVSCFSSLPSVTHLFFGHTLCHSDDYKAPNGSESGGKITDRGLFCLHLPPDQFAPNKIQYIDLINTCVGERSMSLLCGRRDLKWVNFSGTNRSCKQILTNRTLLPMDKLESWEDVDLPERPNQIVLN